MTRQEITKAISRSKTLAGTALLLLLVGTAAGQSSFADARLPELRLAILRVPGDYPTIQSAINAADQGALILVEPGIYRPFYMWEQHLTIRGIQGNDGELPTISGANSPGQAGITAIGGSLVLELFQIHGCRNKFGAGMLTWDCKIHISDCHFGNNVAYMDSYGSGQGGAIYFNSSSWDQSTIERCNFVKNGAEDGEGGAVYCEDGFLHVDESRFIDNAAQSGGAIYAQSGNYVVEGCLFKKNHAVDGGGVRLVGRTGMMLMRCHFYANGASFGGGIFAGSLDRWEGPPPPRSRSIIVPEQACTIVECLFDSNKGSLEGGAILLAGPDMSIWNCLIFHGRHTRDGSTAISFRNNTLCPRCQYSMWDTWLHGNPGRQIVGYFLHGSGNVIDFDDCDGTGTELIPERPGS